jgi:hypothetical protein
VPDSGNAASSNWLFTLANNHIMDYGWKGVENSVRNIKYIGAGAIGVGFDEKLAKSATIKFFRDKKYAFLAFSDLGFGSAGIASPGFASEGPWVNAAIRKLKDEGSKVIVLYHGGVEDHFLPSPGTLEKFLAWSDSGASVIMGTHSHVPQPVIRRGETLMCFGLGNFIVDPSKWKDEDYAGISSVSVSFDPNDPELLFDETFYTCQVNSKGEAVPIESPLHSASLAKRKAAEEVLLSPELHKAVWQEQAVHLYKSYAQKHLIVGSILDYLRPSIVGRASKKVRDFPLLYDALGWSIHHEVMLTATGLSYGLIEDFRSNQSKSYWETLKR